MLREAWVVHSLDSFELLCVRYAAFAKACTRYLVVALLREVIELASPSPLATRHSMHQFNRSVLSRLPLLMAFVEIFNGSGMRLEYVLINILQVNSSPIQTSINTNVFVNDIAFPDCTLRLSHISSGFFVFDSEFHVFLIALRLGVRVAVWQKRLRVYGKRL